MDEQQIEFYRNIAHDLYLVMIREDYGSEGFERLLLLTETITKIYAYLDFSSFSRIVIYSPFDSALSLENIPGSNSVKYNSIQNLSQLQGTQLTIEIRENLEVFVSLEFVPDINFIRPNGIIYQWQNKQEVILGKTEQRPLRKNPYRESWFAIPTYKQLEAALEDYKVKFARMSNCPYLKNVWFNPDRIYFKAGPEDLMRDSLHHFLHGQLRDAEVRPEQNVDTSHPVDIKITWTLTNRLAVIEIKWLGRSLNQAGNRITQNYTQARALEGAKQLKDYLDTNRSFAPHRITNGYLVVFDGRRRGTHRIVNSISKAKADYYVNREIEFNPDYSGTRTDFAKPLRIFLEANISA